MAKIVHITSDMNFGGVGRYLTLMDDFILNQSDEVILVMPIGSVLEDKIKNMRIIKCEGLIDQSFSVKGVLKLFKLLRPLKADIIHTHGALSGRIAGRLLNVPTVFTKHTLSPESTGLKKGIKSFIHKILKSKAIAVSKGAYDNLIEEGFNKNAITIIYNGLEPLEESFGEAPVGEEHDFLNILFVGRLEPVKGPDEFLKILGILKLKVNKPFKVFIAGAGSMAESLKLMAIENDLPVEFLGHVENIETYYLHSDLVVNTSYSEALGYSALEAMSYSKPVVAYDIPGINEVVVNHKSGYLIKPFEFEVFAEKCLLLLEDARLRVEMGQKGKEILKDKFSIHQMMDKLWSVYKEML